MKIEEEIALQKCHTSLLRDLNVKDILPHLFENGMISKEDYEELEEPKVTHTMTDKCKKLLFNITRPGSKCTFLGFTESLRHNDAYSFLADKLEKAKAEEQLMRKESGDAAIGDNSVVLPEQRNSERSDPLYEPVSKINVFTNRRKKIAALAHNLKQLSHNDNTEKFQRVVTAVNARFKKNKLNMTTSVKERMEFADMRFTSIEAEISAKRVRYDRSLEEGDMFNQMESVIPFTSNPRVSSMSYLARYGSKVAMTDSIDDGLAYVQFAKEHAEHVTPCKDTGMVYYIEVNLLSQKYEKDPSSDLKANILKTSDQGIAQFTDENDEIRKDYQRMLLLKRVFCYLGVGLFCKKIERAETTETDIEEAKKVIDFIETSDIWQGMEKRRKMLFYVAKSEFYKQQGNTDLAVVHANEAQKLGQENNWTSELSNISEMVIELERKRTVACQRTDVHKDDILAELFDDFLELEDESEYDSEDKTCSSTNSIERSNGSAVIHGVQETGKIRTGMVDLKECLINDQAEEAVCLATNDSDQILYSRLASACEIQGTEEMHKQMMILKEVRLYDTSEATVCMPTNDCNQRMMTLKEDNIEQIPQGLQCETHQYFNGLNINGNKRDKENIPNDAAKLDSTEMVPCMSYLKSPDNENKKNEIYFLRNQCQLQYKKAHNTPIDNCAHSDLSNNHHLMLLKEQNSISQSELDLGSESPDSSSYNFDIGEGKM